MAYAFFMNASTPGDVAVYAVTAKGLSLGRTLARELPGTLYAPARLAGDGAVPFDSLSALVAETFQQRRAHIFLCACGIAVRAVAPHLRGKAVDPAVVCLDDAATFAVSLLSGHLGGANDLARRLAGLTGAVPVVTTATDAAGAPAIELLARDAGLFLDNPVATRRVNAALAAGEPVAVFDPLGLFAPPEAAARHFVWLADPAGVGPDEPLVVVDWRAGPATPTRLYLRPRVLAAGIGCRKGASAEAILELVDAACRQYRLAPAAIGQVASIEAKRHEPGLLEAARRLGAGTVFFSADELSGISVPHPSAMAAKHMGVESVCEAAAILAANRGRLVAPKTKNAVATLALALAR